MAETCPALAGSCENVIEERFAPPVLECRAIASADPLAPVVIEEDTCQLG
jgi:hypothetical protein